MNDTSNKNVNFDIIEMISLKLKDVNYSCLSGIVQTYKFILVT